MAADRDTEPPWPLVLYHADPRTRKLARSERQVTAMSASLSARTTALAAAQAQAEEQTQRGNALANELERATVELTSVRQALSQAQVEQARSTTSCTEALHQARQTVERLERELAQAEVTVSRVERFRQLREADLQDLQQRHAALLDERRSLHLLLAGLADRLGAARDLVGKARGQGDGNDLTEPGAAKELRP
jgi:chromosome segregation ATPase